MAHLALVQGGGRLHWLCASPLVKECHWVVNRGAATRKGAARVGSSLPICGFRKRCAGPTHCVGFRSSGRTPHMHGNSCAPCCFEYGARPLSQGCLGWAVGVHSPSSRSPSGDSPMNTMCQHHCHIREISISITGYSR